MKRNNLILSFFFIVALTLVAQSCEHETYAQGKRLYEAHCENCHMEDGNGLAKLIPPLQNSDYLKNNQDKIACILKNGQKGKVIVNGIEYNQEMPGKNYTAVQITNITNYINNAWGNQYGVTNLEQSSNALKKCN